MTTDPRIRVGLLGDYRPDFPPLPATEQALLHAAADLGAVVWPEWIASPRLDTMTDADLAAFDGLWVAPGSPYRSLGGILRGIGFARRHRTPLLGTCAGFQHVVLEYARHVLGLERAHSEEYGPDDAGELVVTLSTTCELAGRTLLIDLEPGTLAAAIYGGTQAKERYYCRFSLAERYRAPLEAAGLQVIGTDAGEPHEARIVAIPEHPFFLATLYVPQVASEPGRPHPIVSYFVRAALLEARARAERRAAEA